MTARAVMSAISRQAQAGGRDWEASQVPRGRKDATRWQIGHLPSPEKRKRGALLDAPGLSVSPIFRHGEIIMATTQTPTCVNGVDLDVLQETVKAIQEDPGLGPCKFRARNQWLGATHNRSTISDFYGAKEERSHKQEFELDADEPPILAGGDDGANPVEHLLHALASCVTTSMIAHAAVRGIHIEAMESELEGDIDLRGFLGLDPDMPKGFTSIRMKFKVKTDPKNLKQLRRLAEFSPVFNTLTHGVPVDIDIASR
jgi:uncharacterized OsmC-like protein